MVGNGDALHYDASAFGRMVDKGSGGALVRLKASMVDSLGKCGQVDPTPFLQQDVCSVVGDPAALFPLQSLPKLNTDVRFTAGDSNEYVFLLRQQCRAGKVVLGHTCKHLASFVFRWPKLVRRDSERSGMAAF